MYIYIFPIEHGDFPAKPAMLVYQRVVFPILSTLAGPSTQLEKLSGRWRMALQNLPLPTSATSTVPTSHPPCLGAQGVVCHQVFVQKDRGHEDWKIQSSVTTGCFPKLWYPQIIHFHGFFPYKPSILGYPYFWKHPFGI